MVLEKGKTFCKFFLRSVKGRGIVNNRYLLDTSALLACIESEEGDERVKFILKNENVSIPWIALVELFYVTSREKGEKPPNCVMQC